jgi:hypothetical protein
MNVAPDGTSRAVIFRVVTDFEVKVRRPGGLPRDQALLNARIRVQRLTGQGDKARGKAPAKTAPSRRPPGPSNK